MPRLTRFTPGAASVAHVQRGGSPNLFSKPILLAVFACALALLLSPVAAAVPVVMITVVAEIGSANTIATPHFVADGGRTVVYAESLAAGNGHIVKDVVTGISVPIAGSNPSISGDGNFVAYQTEDEARFAVLWTREGGLTEIVSLSNNEETLSSTGYGAMVSATGRYVGFLSSDPLLTLPQGWDWSNDGGLVLIRDRMLGTTEVINVTPGGTASGGYIVPSFSDDFSVAAWRGEYPWGSGQTGVVIWRRATNSLTLIPDLTTSGPWGVMLSGNGRFVVGGSIDGDGSIKVHDLETNTSEVVGIGTFATISDDGRYVAYVSPDRVAYRYDRSQGQAVRVSYGVDGAPMGSGAAAISGDGIVVFAADSGQRTTAAGRTWRSTRAR
jgi:hypothetical protein